MFIKINLKTVSILIISILLDLALGFALGFSIGGSEGLNRGLDIGFQHERETSLKHCKEAGWEFIDDVFSFARISKTDQRLTPEALEELRHLQSKIATKCIVRFNKKNTLEL